MIVTYFVYTQLKSSFNMISIIIVKLYFQNMISQFTITIEIVF